MENIKEFKDLEEYSEFAESLTVQYINSGSEGSVYLTKDGDIIKKYHSSDINNRIKIYIPGKYIMDGDIKVDSFIFPTELHICDGYVCGLRAAYFKNNIFTIGHSLIDVDLDNILIAREKFREDVKILSEEGYALAELSRNTMYNNEVFKAIDTLEYGKTDADITEANLKEVDDAIATELSFLTDPRIYSKYSFEDMYEEAKRIKKLIG